MFKHKNATGFTQFVYALFATLIEFLASIIIIYLITVTFGASLIEDFNGTLLFSILISSISFMPSFILIEHQDPFSLLTRLFIKNEYNSNLEIRLVKLSLGAIIGSWFGALVIPLDWDRWWQEWPISCCIGALVGSFIGLLFSGLTFKNKIKQHF